MHELSVADAARNNALWCDAVFRTHGGGGEFSAPQWWSAHLPPAGYPNLVTLQPSIAPAMAVVHKLEQAPPSRCWAVKDSFGVLPLHRAGFRLLFEAEWIFRPPVLGCSHPEDAADRWTRVQSKSVLAAWEEAWGESAGAPRVFLPALLRQDDVAILAALGSGGGITAGVIANRTGSAVGFSNLFVRGEPKEALRAQCMAAVGRAFPGLPLVGYEAGRSLVECCAMGFRPLGRLRVWSKEG